jgi:tRNA(fMet)-specific endonuclease VapC
MQNGECRMNPTLRSRRCAELRRKGRPIGAYDLLIGATALRRGLVLVTSNTDQFAHGDSLILEDWRLGT